MIVGHVVARKALYGSYLTQMPVVLLLGPESVGKWTIACASAQVSNASEFDVMFVPELTADKAREVVAFCQKVPIGDAKVVIIDLDGAVEHAITILLKTLEEPPDTVRFILVASSSVLPTVASRAQVIRFGLLSEAEVQAILVDQGVPEAQAHAAALVSRGRVGPALTAIKGAGPARDAVTAALRAVQSGDPAALRRAFRDWGDAEHQMLLTWAAESSLGRSPVIVPVNLGKEAGRWVLMHASASGTSVWPRPAIGDRVVLEEYMLHPGRR